MDVHLLSASLANVPREGAVGEERERELREARMRTNDVVGKVVRVRGGTVHFARNGRKVALSQKGEVGDQQQVFILLEQFAHSETTVLHVALDSVQRARVLVVGMHGRQFQHVGPILWFDFKVHTAHDDDNEWNTSSSILQNQTCQ